ncbi:hypothetical protein [Rhodopseudomonas sp. B29]|uniref:hypothetical protein n=1 Tax=Rhodopseudomonas sp. B29 TaxID=95607 RepID=UPI0003B57C2C|nr:hypothetical protein [Rhodopseudomonas sp. B29]
MIRRIVVSRLLFAALPAVLLGGCAFGGGSSVGDDGAGDGPQPFPTNYRSDIPAFLRSYLNDPTGLHAAMQADPMPREVAGRTRYLSCVRFTMPSGKQQQLAIVHVGGRPDRVGGPFAELCAGAVYAPFPELEKLSR